MHTFFINALIELYCLRHVSIQPRLVHAVLWYDLCISIGSLVDVDIQITMKLHEQVFFMMNTWLLESHRKQ